MTAIDERERQSHREAEETEPRHRVAAGALLTAGMAVALGAALLDLPREHAPLPEVARYAMQVALPGWHLTEPVNEVVYGTRGFDTFGETFLLLAAVVSVVLLSRPREPRTGYFGEDVAGEREQSQVEPAQPPDAQETQARDAESAETDQEADDRQGSRGHQGQRGQRGQRGEKSGRSRQRPANPDGERLGTYGPERAEAMSIVVRGAVRAATPILAVTGCYLVAWGYSPGGGFPGGAVVLGVVLLVYAGFGRKRVARVVRPTLIETIEMAGAALIILTEALGLFLKGSFSANWLPLAPPATIRSGGIAQLFSGGELIEVGTGLIIAVFALLAMGHDWSRDESAAEDGKAARQGEGAEGAEGAEGRPDRGETGTRAGGSR